MEPEKDDSKKIILIVFYCKVTPDQTYYVKKKSEQKLDCMDMQVNCAFEYFIYFTFATSQGSVHLVSTEEKKTIHLWQHLLFYSCILN